MEELKKIIESLLFVAEDPLTAHTLSKAAGNQEIATVRKALDELIAEYRERDGGFFLAQVAGGYQFRTTPENTQWIKRLIQPNAPRLSKAALETLAIIAYKQPVIRADVERIRGVDSGGVIRMLLERKLLRVLGRKEIPGRPLIYATTKLFLQVFDLKDLRDLPSPKEIEDMALESGQIPGSSDPAGENEKSASDLFPEPSQATNEPVTTTVSTADKSPQD
jgi:segregation and condensation protein B